MSVAMLLLMAATSGGMIYSAAKGVSEGKLENSYEQYKKVIKHNNLDSLSTKDIIEDLWQGGVIDEREYKNSLRTIDKLENTAHSGTKTFKELWQSVFTSPRTQNEGAELYKLIAANAHYLNSNKAKSYDDLVKAVNDSFYTGLPTIADAPTPQYLDTMFAGTQVDVADAKKWTAPELAAQKFILKVS